MVKSSIFKYVQQNSIHDARTHVYKIYMAIWCKTPQAGEVKFEVMFVPFTSETFVLPRPINVLFNYRRVVILNSTRFSCRIAAFVFPPYR